MRDKYKSCGLNYDLIIEKYPSISEYEETVNAYLDDDFFKQLKEMLINEDYAMAKDACKGLYILANDLYLFPLYETLLELYEDLEYETYSETSIHYNDVLSAHHKVSNMFKN